MIKAAIILNASGKVLLLRIYESFISESQEKDFLAALHNEVSEKKGGTNFIIEEEILKDQYTIVCRRYETICFVLICDEHENELALLDFIHIFAEVLDKVFTSVCEYDIVCNPDKVNYVLDELIVDGNVVQINVKEAVESLKQQEKIEAS
eukprot:TRINITY_DN12517_c0_g4_i1.p1 TRINITY_DN12517_c0_g4~~TRINITY_DN12517_c0_g4_i1.p1  ORF type:complete len:150 (-),score=48.60 TRINITY_DN12517_c0_g4_i1:100-549(-)